MRRKNPWRKSGRHRSRSFSKPRRGAARQPSQQLHVAGDPVQRRLPWAEFQRCGSCVNVRIKTEPEPAAAKVASHLRARVQARSGSRQLSVYDLTGNHTGREIGGRKTTRGTQTEASRVAQQLQMTSRFTVQRACPHLRRIPRGRARPRARHVGPAHSAPMRIPIVRNGGGETERSTSVVTPSAERHHRP